MKSFQLFVEAAGLQGCRAAGLYVNPKVTDAVQMRVCVASDDL